MIPRLPPEIWERILEYAGSKYFQADIRHLTICKAWASFGERILYRNLRLTPEILVRLTQLPISHPAFAILCENLECLHLSLHGFDDWDTALLKLRSTGFVEPVRPQAPQRTPDMSGDQMTLIYDFRTEDFEYSMSGILLDIPDREDFVAILGNSLEILWTRLQEASRLTAIYVDSEVEKFPTWYMKRKAYLNERNLLGLRNIKTLKILHLDLNGTGLDPDYGTGGQLNFGSSRPHLCDSLRGLLPQLTRLHIRLHKLCPRLLSTPEAIAKVNPNMTELVVNLSLDPRDEDGNSRFINREPSRCDDAPWASWNDPHNLDSQMVLITQQLNAPRKVQALYRMAHEGGDDIGPLRVFDANKIEYFELKDTTSWGEAGEYTRSHGFEWDRKGYWVCGRMTTHPHISHKYMYEG